MKTENLKDMDKMDQIIHNAFNMNASDIHIEPNSSDVVLRYRIDGLLKVIERFDFRAFEKIMEKLKIMAGFASNVRAPQDGRFIFPISGKKLDMRVSTVPSINGDSVCIRLLNPDTCKLAKLENIRMSEENLMKLKKWYSSPCRMIITSGPSGSGKTTLLYMIINELNKESLKVCTVEDPVEIQLDGVVQVPVKLKDGVTFSSAARAFLRQDPDVIVLGQIRDLDTLELGVQSVLWGHLVITCMYAENSIATIFRLKDIGLPLFLIKDCMPGVIAQRLVRCLCPECREIHAPNPEELNGINLPNTTYYKAKGCEKCHNTGYKGRIPICELFEFSPKTAEMFMNGSSEKELVRQAVSEGMKTLLDDAIAKAAGGLTSLEEIQRVLTYSFRK